MIIFKKNSVIEFILINKRKIEKPPTIAPDKIDQMDTFRLSSNFTVISNKKSKKKFRKNTTSKYIFISSPNSVYKNDTENCVVLEVYYHFYFYNIIKITNKERESSVIVIINQR